MNRRRTLGVIEFILQVVTIVSSIVAIISMVKNYRYKVKLRQKAEGYLDEEIGEFQDIKRKIRVFSPEIKCREDQIKKLLLLTSTGVLSLLLIGIFKRD